MNFSSLGWSQMALVKSVPVKELARVIAVHRSNLRAVTLDKEVNLYYRGGSSESVAVGDWVRCSLEFVDEQNQTARIILEVCPRDTKLSRAVAGKEQIIAANIDTVFVLTSINQDLNTKRLHRYLVLIREGGARPVVVLSKADLDVNAKQVQAELANSLGVPVHLVSAVTGKGIAELQEQMPWGSMSVFVGSSGVGKSTLVNALLAENIQKTQEVRENDAKGRHTTTARQMFIIPGGGTIIDTPGIREIQIYGQESSLAETFPKIHALTSDCRFNDCQHDSEPGCAIQEALESGNLNHAEWNSYRKLQREMAFVNRKIDKVEISNAKKRWRDINAAMRKRKKFEDR